MGLEIFDNVSDIHSPSTVYFLCEVSEKVHKTIKVNPTLQ